LLSLFPQFAEKHTVGDQTRWYLADYVVLTSSAGRRSGLRTADTLTLEVPRTWLSFGDRVFSVTGLRTSNFLLTHIRFAQSMYSFGKLKNLLYSTVRILYLIRVLTLSGAFVALFAYFALNLSLYITLQDDNDYYYVCLLTL